MHVAAVARRPPSYTVKLLERVLFCCPTVASRATAVTGTDGRWSCCLLRVRGCRRTGTLPLSTKTRRRKDIELDDDLIPSSVRQANKLLRRHLLRAQTLRAKAAAQSESARESAEAQERRAREVLEAYEFSKYGAELPPLSAFGHLPDSLNDEESTEAGEAEIAEATVPVSGNKDGDINMDETTTLSALFIGLHRRVLCRVTYKGSRRVSSDYENPGEEALAYFRQIKEMGCFPPRFLCSLLVQLLVNEGMDDEAEEVFQDLIARSVSPTEACATEIIRLRVQRGQLDRAMEVLAMLEGEEFRKDIPKLRFRSYQPVIRGLFQRGDIDGVLKLWKHMQWHKILPKESFMLDLMADLSNCPEGAKGEQATSVADQIMDGVSQTLMYPSAPTVAALLEGWGAVWTDVSEQGTCMACGSKLQKMGLSALDRRQMRSSIMRVAALRSAREVQRLSWFASWFSSLEETPTAVIDGPNVAYMGQNHPGGSFRLEQVDWLAEHLNSMGEHVLIVMPWFYCMPEATHSRRDNGPMRKLQLSEEDSALLQKWTDRNWLIMTEGLDDLYWMYSTVAHDEIDTVVLTNDAMRDHRNFMPSARHFVRWKRGHMVRYSFEWGEGGVLAWQTKRDKARDTARDKVRDKARDKARAKGCDGDSSGVDASGDGGAPSGFEEHPTIKLVSGAVWDEIQRSGENWHLPVRLSGTANWGAGSTPTRPHGVHAKNWLCIPVPKTSASGAASTESACGDSMKASRADSSKIERDTTEEGTEDDAEPSDDDIHRAATA